VHVLWQVRGVDARQWPRPLVPDTTEKMLDDVRVVARTAPHERLVRDWALVLMAVVIVGTPMLESLRLHTTLDETRSGLATALMGERLLELLKSERILTRAEMLDYWSLDRQEGEIAGEQADVETAEQLEGRADAATQRQLRELAQRMEREVEGRQRRFERQAQQVSRTSKESGACRSCGAPLPRSGSSCG